MSPTFGGSGAVLPVSGPPSHFTAVTFSGVLLRLWT
jgi:hypothetical protein